MPRRCCRRCAPSIGILLNRTSSFAKAGCTTGQPPSPRSSRPEEKRKNKLMRKTLDSVDGYLQELVRTHGWSVVWPGSRTARRPARHAAGPHPQGGRAQPATNRSGTPSDDPGPRHLPPARRRADPGTGRGCRQGCSTARRNSAGCWLDDCCGNTAHRAGDPAAGNGLPGKDCGTDGAPGQTGGRRACPACPGRPSTRLRPAMCPCPTPWAKDHRPRPELIPPEPRTRKQPSRP